MKKKFSIEGQLFEKIPDQICAKCGEEIYRSIFTGRWKHHRDRQFCRGAKPKT